ncbi:hypothetical protein FISHEDRAFT_57099 [Fistulina hepatica ATCC 64428]|nr:hypothetical protein FISHEDRAFT_57099 [Fistulina hepatica ATCC 64428]
MEKVVVEEVYINVKGTASAKAVWTNTNIQRKVKDVMVLCDVASFTLRTTRDVTLFHQSYYEVRYDGYNGSTFDPDNELANGSGEKLRKPLIEAHAGTSARTREEEEAKDFVHRVAEEVKALCGKELIGICKDPAWRSKRHQRREVRGASTKEGTQWHDELNNKHESPERIVGGDVVRQRIPCDLLEPRQRSALRAKFYTGLFTSRKSYGKMNVEEDWACLNDNVGERSSRT